MTVSGIYNFFNEFLNVNDPLIVVTPCGIAKLLNFDPFVAPKYPIVVVFFGRLNLSRLQASEIIFSVVLFDIDSSKSGSVKALRE